MQFIGEGEKDAGVKKVWLTSTLDADYFSYMILRWPKIPNNKHQIPINLNSLEFGAYYLVLSEEACKSRSKLIL